MDKKEREESIEDISKLGSNLASAISNAKKTMSRVHNAMDNVCNISAISSNKTKGMFSHDSFMQGGTQKPLKKVIEDLNENDDSANPEDICVTCAKNICSHTSYSLRKYVRIEDSSEDELIECNDFCSRSCLKAFSDKNEETIEEYQLYEVSRCSGYYDCLDLENIRGICEKQERLNCNPGLYSIPSLHNFCEPADAGIIKASINIKKQLDEGSKQNSFHFKLTAFMTVLVIILTIVNTLLILETNYEQQLDNMDTKLGSINNSLSSLNDQASTISSDLDSNTLLVSSILLNILENTNQTVEFSNKS